MKLTGNETYPIRRGNRTIQAGLSEMSDDEILAVANSGCVGYELRRALYAYQWRRRQQEAAGIRPGPQAA